MFRRAKQAADFRIRRSGRSSTASWGTAEPRPRTGFRATFRTSWATEQTSFPWEVCELSLGDKVGSNVERAYQRGDALKKRAAIMQAWADFLSPSPRTARSSHCSGRRQRREFAPRAIRGTEDEGRGGVAAVRNSIARHRLYSRSGA